MLRIYQEQQLGIKRPSIASSTTAPTVTPNNASAMTAHTPSLTTTTNTSQEKSQAQQANSVSASPTTSLATQLLSLNSNSNTNGSQTATPQNHRSIITSSQLKCK